MRQPTIALAVTAALFATSGAAIGALPVDKAALEAAVGAASRTPANVARDPYRHPVETLSFFGVEPDDTVVEIWPGGGWYTEILAPYVKDAGKLYVTDLALDRLKGVQALQAKDPALYGKVEFALFPAFGASPAVPAGSADVVLTFRNVHNWRMGYQRDRQDYSADAFREMFAMLKPGGVLGVVDHRLPESASDEREKNSGYIKASTVKRLAQEAGFVLEAESEVNANPNDSADWPKGVWTLPPRFAEGETDKAKYAAIGESDRMTLKFRKPK